MLRARYGQRKVFLLGLSYGSAIGLSVAVKRPDLLQAYIGVGQLIDGRENEQAGFEWTVAQAQADHNGSAIAALEALKPYPGDGPLSVSRTMIERNWNIHYGGLVAYRPDADWYFHLGRLSPLYTTADRQAWDAGSDLTMKTVWPALIDISFKKIDRLAVPVFFFIGRHDYTTPARSLPTGWLASVRRKSASIGSKTRHTSRLSKSRGVCCKLFSKCARSPCRAISRSAARRPTLVIPGAKSRS